VVTEITLDHEFLMSSLHTDSERALSRIALEMHPGHDLDVLVGGLGLGYTAAEALDSDRVVAVEAVEFLPQVADWMERGMVPLSDRLGTDRRFRLTRGDVYGRLLAEPDRGHDLVLIDVDHSPDEPLGEESARFYTAEGLRAARRHLRDGGVLGVWSWAESSPFLDALREVFAEVRVEPVRFHNRLIDEPQEDWLFFARG
jgi:spermidine synthase